MIAQHQRYGADRSAGSIRLVPPSLTEERLGLFELGLGRDLRAPQRRPVDHAVRKEFQRDIQAADLERFGLVALEAVPDDHLARGAPDIDHQAPLRARGERVHATLEHEAGLLATRDDLDREAQRVLRLEQKLVRIQCLAQRLRPDRAHVRGGHAPQSLVDARQAFGGRLDGFPGQAAALVQAGCESHDLLPVAAPLDMRSIGAPDLEAEAVGADVDCGEQHAGGDQWPQWPVTGR